MHRARGFVDLAFDVVEQTTHLVERTHDAVVERSSRRLATIEPLRGATTLVTRFETTLSGGVFESIRRVNRAVRQAVSAAGELTLAGVEAPTARPPSRAVDQLQSVINGFWGDTLSRRKSGLDLGMTLRHRGRELPVDPAALATACAQPTTKLCVFIHGLAATEHQWSAASGEHDGLRDATYGTRLRDDLGFTPLHLRYNTGRHVSENGRALALLLTDVLDAYPLPVEQIALVGHSMGGLVARSAAHYGREHDEPWVRQLRHVVCLGSPNLGAPLEKAANLLGAALGPIDAAGAQVPLELLNSRSAGVKDLRHGYTIDEEWTGKDPDASFADGRSVVPLVDGVRYSFLAATISRDPDHPLGRLLGDLLVRLPSASGAADEPARRIRFCDGAVIPGVNHFEIANHPRVYEALRDLLETGGRAGTVDQALG